MTDDQEVEYALLRYILNELSPTAKKRIAAKLEREKKSLSDPSAPGHVPWFEHKAALCAAMKRLSS
jgi:hypothetical protein